VLAGGLADPSVEPTEQPQPVDSAENSAPDVVMVWQCVGSAAFLGLIIGVVIVVIVRRRRAKMAPEDGE
jgi:hypothetical protein